ncbi:GPALPP motifs-containing protein 1 [Harmonia axyridis]|uniref:GPALPP motifs-containing protein 1 n=1 Tax=Harmonia axyridis TaxID=115357 RepID=UPI001E277F4E|nr:GPALPP motifs-containing protein 1 [Harmonia axyridis]XP_045472599.1 GPALPP motifs-containing protein 1 [Harmonia axyridis]
MENNERKIYGPILPVAMGSKQGSDDDRYSEEEKILEDNERGDLNQAYGPVLPINLQKQKNSDSASIGPSLPSHMKEKLEGKILEEDHISIGPSLPPHMRGKLEENVLNEDNTTIGPSLPPHMREKLGNTVFQEDLEEDSSEEDTYGPALPGQEFKSKNAIALEERALEMKLNQLNPGQQKKEREEWMIELPTVSASKLGLGPRQFRPTAGPDLSDRSSWTNTPNAKNKKKADTNDLRKEMENSELRKRDREQEKRAKKHKRDTESLVEMHQKKRKKDKEAGPKARVPFNRETDLQVNRFDEAQKAAVLKKAQLLDDRFSSGKTKFL